MIKNFRKRKIMKGEKNEGEMPQNQNLGEEAGKKSDEMLAEMQKKRKEQKRIEEAGKYVEKGSKEHREQLLDFYTNIEKYNKLPDELLEAVKEDAIEIIFKFDGVGENKYSTQIILKEENIEYETTSLKRWWIEEQGGNNDDKLPCIYDGSHKIWFDPRTGDKLDF